ncbi:MAG: DMT family transporter [Desulfobacterales bacterium]|nr:DMT family transporter [Desulfobacterales bacterium]
MVADARIVLAPLMDDRQVPGRHPPPKAQLSAPQVASGPYLILSVAPLCWAGNIVLARGVAELIPPVAFAFWRWTLAFVADPALQPCGSSRGTAKELARRWKMLLLLRRAGHLELQHPALHRRPHHHGHQRRADPVHHAGRDRAAER